MSKLPVTLYSAWGEDEQQFEGKREKKLWVNSKERRGETGGECIANKINGKCRKASEKLFCDVRDTEEEIPLLCSLQETTSPSSQGGKIRLGPFFQENFILSCAFRSNILADKKSLKNNSCAWGVGN